MEANSTISMTTLIPELRDAKTSARAARHRPDHILNLPDLEVSRRHSLLIKPVAKRSAKAMKRQLVLGYPDEWLTFLAFADSVAVYARRGVWAPAYPTANDLAAIVIDFISPSQEDADALLRFGWTLGWDEPHCVDQIFAWRVKNAQNAECRRELCVLATGISRLAFAGRVAASLPSADAPNHIKQRAMSFYDVLAIVGDGVGSKRVTLISKWRPSRQLRTKLKDHEFKFVWRPLSGIPAKDLAAVSVFHLWHGTRAQGKTFLAQIWGRG